MYKCVCIIYIVFGTVYTNLDSETRIAEVPPVPTFVVFVF